MAPAASLARVIRRNVLPATALGCIALQALGASARELSHHGSRRSQPVPTSQSAPDMTGSTPRAPQTAMPAPPQADKETLPPLFNLPPASRARMRTCGERWQAKKLAGQAGDEIWREFATQCLSDKN